MTAASVVVLIGTYTGGGSRGIYAADWDAKVGALGRPRLVAECENPSYLTLHPARTHVYAVSERWSSGGGAVLAYPLDGSSSVPVSTVPSHGNSPCHLAVDPRGEFLVVSNYSSGTASMYRLTNGLPVEPAAVLRLEGKGPNAERQEGPHAHSACFDPTGERIHVVDLGTDRLWGYALDRAAGTVRPLDPPFTAIAPGSGPRHMAFHPTLPRAYVINELNSTVTVLSWDRATGKLAPVQTAGTLPKGADDKGNSCADIHVSPDGRFLYGSNRGHDSVAVWKIAPKTGKLSSVQHVSSGGGHPRNFTLSPDGRWLLCANRDANNVVVFRRDARSGKLSRVSSLSVPRPVCLVFSARRMEP